MTPGDLTKALATTAITADCSTVEIQRFPSDVPAFELSSPHPDPDPFDDEVASEFSDGADDHDGAL